MLLIMIINIYGKNDSTVVLVNSQMQGLKYKIKIHSKEQQK